MPPVEIADNAAFTAKGTTSLPIIIRLLQFLLCLIFLHALPNALARRHPDPPLRLIPLDMPRLPAAAALHASRRRRRSVRSSWRGNPAIAPTNATVASTDTTVTTQT